MARPGVKPGTRNNLQHGGEAGLKAISQGLPLPSPAREMEETVRTELETIGRGEIVTQAATRLEAVARLFYNAFIDAAQQGV